MPPTHSPTHTHTHVLEIQFSLATARVKGELHQFPHVYIKNDRSLTTQPMENGLHLYTVVLLYTARGSPGHWELLGFSVLLKDTLTCGQEELVIQPSPWTWNIWMIFFNSDKKRVLETTNL